MQTGELESAKRQARKRIGRGPGSGTGKTAGKGENGQLKRSGYSHRPWFEGGQMPLQRRIPKRGFTPINRVEYQVINVSTLEERFSDGDTVNYETLKANRLVANAKTPIKILGAGELTKKLTVAVDKFTKTAEVKITNAGGEIQIVKTTKTASASE
jgi:large subunit ribosomal protein L15